MPSKGTLFSEITPCKEGARILHAHQLSKNIPDEVQREINFLKGHKQDSTENSSEDLIV